MQLSHATGYALQALVTLARQEGGRGLKAAALAKAHGLPGLFLGKALTSLARAGVLVSLKGPNGGYRLARPPAEITLLRVIEAVQGPLPAGLQPAFWMRGAAPLDARLEAICAGLAKVWRQQLQAVTLADLAGVKSARGRKTP